MPGAMRPVRVKEATVCGGWRTVPSDYKPTPQPGDFVEILVCTKCHKRARRGTVVYESKSISIAKPRHRWSKDKDEYAIRRCNWKRITITSRKTTIGPCCARKENHSKRVGRVERSIWSKTKKGAPSTFFLVVHVPALKKRIWCDLESIIKLVAATDYLIENIGDI